MKNTGRIFDIAHGSYVDGPGIRTTVFFKGCHLRCAWCHNPESRSFAAEKMVYADKCVGCGKCKTVCPSPDNCLLCGKCALFCPRGAIRVVGKDVSVTDVMAEIEKDRPFYGEDGGVTFSGGECLLQPDFLEELLLACRAAGIRCAVDTAGDVPYEVFSRILPLTDLFLFDVKGMDEEKHERYTGVKNDRILDNLARLLSVGARVWIRVPVIPGVNDTAEEMTALREFLVSHGKPEKIELLPYHRLGENKYAALSLPVPAFDVPPKEKIRELYAVVAGE